MLMLCSICSEVFDSPGTICPVCGCGLVPASLPVDSAKRSMARGESRLVELCRPGSFPVAMMIKQTLEQNGIPVLIPGGNSLSIMPHLAFSGELRIMVPESDLDAARELYCAYFEGEERPQRILEDEILEDEIAEEKISEEEEQPDEIIEED